MGLLVHHEYPFDGEEHPFDGERAHMPCTASEYPGWGSGPELSSFGLLLMSAGEGERMC